ncbi:MAG TPA: hypothetical protein P5320_11485, partial [Bacteroidales bacterium]|nr:hypothetical protein [Bacteroidales bacterium]
MQRTDNPGFFGIAFKVIISDSDKKYMYQAPYSFAVEDHQLTECPMSKNPPLIVRKPPGRAEKP